MSINLFEPYKIGRLELKNRFVRSATYDATADSSGAVTERSLTLYRQLAQGNIGLIVTGYAFVSLIGQAAVGQYGVHNDDMISGLCRLVQIVHHHGGKIALQIVHAGINHTFLRRKDTMPLSVSRITNWERPHREMTSDEIESVITDFATAARRGVEAGFDAVQLHGAHGYLMSQFISPLANFRTDQWGGSPENRRRFHLEVVSRVRESIGAHFPLLIKFGAQDDLEGGLPLSEGIETAKLMVARGINAIEVSAGLNPGVRKESEPKRAYFLERAAALKPAVTVPIIIVGGIRSLAMAQSIIDNGNADLISMCRPFIRQPDLIARWQRGETKSADCISCSRCLGITSRGEPLECGEERRLLEEAPRRTRTGHQ